ncbi:MAG: hypothetical protein BJ554DRAFT_3805 [Olpidium bornovanus]|uniref:Uncharacterized protein n=1 Tax=Olpidium bornovanus TaxID=278681 RepID=A0A8H8DFE3_9FUNG|nr:MAG: hypothetical protein BJ554DRAFT_3805 [Olpidium bornovanus]
MREASSNSGPFDFVASVPAVFSRPPDETRVPARPPVDQL